MCVQKEINKYGIIPKWNNFDNEIILYEKRILQRDIDEEPHTRRISRWILVYIYIYIKKLLAIGIQRVNHLTFFSRLVYRTWTRSPLVRACSVEILRHAPSSVLLEKPDACRFIADIYPPKQRRLGKHSRFVAHKISDAHTIQCVQRRNKCTIPAYVHWLRVCTIYKNIIRDIRTQRDPRKIYNCLCYAILICKKERRINKLFFNNAIYEKKIFL